MAFALTLHFDSGIADAISSCWERLADAGISRSMLDPGYPPHVTLAVHDRLTVDTSLAALDRVFEKIAEIGVTLTDVTTFGAGSGVCYAALAASPDLIQLQAAVVGAMGSGCRQHYQIGDWTPHCTLTMGASDAEVGREGFVGTALAACYGRSRCSGARGVRSGRRHQALGIENSSAVQPQALNRPCICAGAGRAASRPLSQMAQVVRPALADLAALRGRLPVPLSLRG